MCLKITGEVVGFDFYHEVFYEIVWCNEKSFSVYQLLEDIRENRVSSFPEESKVKVNFLCPEAVKKQFSDGICILPISVGQAYHEGDKFIATMDLINETFDSCLIVLCDTLQRHNLKLAFPLLSDQELRKNSLVLGDEWLSRNKNFFSYLKIELDVVRWDEWRNDKYSLYRKRVEECYFADGDYKKAVDETVNRFLNRRNLLGDSEAFNLCREYILEECSVTIMFFDIRTKKFVVYPKKSTKALEETYKQFLKNEQSDLIHRVSLKFKSRIIPKTLSFSYVDNEKTLQGV